jgi:Carboxypeptidase regulatory-like domain/TonB-dependent Receptor Plug Domain
MAMNKRKAARPLRGRRLLVACSLLCVVLLARGASAQSNATQGTIRGRVLDETTGAPIPEVNVEFMDGTTRVRGSAITDAGGNFILGGMPRGSFRLRASRLGYARALTPYWRVEGGEILTVTVRLHPDAVLLAPLEINARAQSASPVLAGFYRRARVGNGGTFITRAEIERANAGLITDLIRMVPGVRIEAGINIQSRSVYLSRALGMCPVQIWVDGMLATRNGSEGVVLDEIAPPSLLEGIEIHRGIGTVPPEFITPEARCGVIALWTRRGG